MPKKPIKPPAKKAAKKITHRNAAGEPCNNRIAREENGKYFCSECGVEVLGLKPAKREDWDDNDFDADAD
jgi:hypothetical protein